MYIHVYIWRIYCQNMEYHWQTKIKLNVVSKDALEYALPESSESILKNAPTE